jgi:hypothetical protein
MLEITCDNCGVVGKLSLVQESYKGPYRCWKCRALFRITIEDEKLKSCVPMSEEQFEKEQQMES